jgi:hypothetical protein
LILKSKMGTAAKDRKDRRERQRPAPPQRQGQRTRLAGQRRARKHRLAQQGEWRRDAGGEAIEVVSGSHTPGQYAEWAAVAQRYGFAASRGSDFHGVTESGADLGSLPPLPSDLKPVWHDW